MKASKVLPSPHVRTRPVCPDLNYPPSPAGTKKSGTVISHPIKLIFDLFVTTVG
jgi:hypothetical protein